MAFVRVKGPDGDEFTIDEAAVPGMGDAVTVLDKPALDRSGRPLPVKPHIDLAGAVRASAEKPGTKAPEKEAR